MAGSSPSGLAKRRSLLSSLGGRPPRHVLAHEAVRHGSTEWASPSNAGSSRVREVGLPGSYRALLGLQWRSRAKLKTWPIRSPVGPFFGWNCSLSYRHGHRVDGKAAAVPIAHPRCRLHRKPDGAARPLVVGEPSGVRPTHAGPRPRWLEGASTDFADGYDGPLRANGAHGVTLGRHSKIDVAGASGGQQTLQHPPPPQTERGGTGPPRLSVRIMWRASREAPPKRRRGRAALEG